MTTTQTAAQLAPAAFAMGPSAVSRIYCGRCIPGGTGTVTDDDLSAFVDGEVSNRFPNGFTVLTGQGGWRDVATQKTIREDTVVFEVMHDAEQEGAVYEVARAYKLIFKQDAVAVTTTPMVARFV